MTYRILKHGIGKINFTDFAFRKVGQHLLADFGSVGEQRLVHCFGIILRNLIAPSCQSVTALAAYGINHNILFLHAALCYEFHNVGIVAAGKTSVGGNHDDSLLPLSCTVQIRMVDISGLFQHGFNGSVHRIEVRLRLFRTRFCFLQLYGSDKLHRLCNLLCALNTFPASLYVTHGCHNVSPTLSLRYAYYLNSFLNSSITFTISFSMSSVSCFSVRIPSGSSGYLVSINSKRPFSNSIISSTSTSSKNFFVAA